MRCQRCREALSARLDGEVDASEQQGEVEAHLRGCADCRRWLDDAAHLTRLARMSVAGPVPEVGPDVLAAAPGPARARLAGALWVALAAVGGSQLLLGLVQMTTSLPPTHLPTHPSGGGLAANSHHLWTESAAWNMAIGAGFLWAAVRRFHASALVPVLTAFVALLTLFTANDLWSGRVDPQHLLSHGFVIVGYVLLMVLTRSTLRLTSPPSGPGRATTTSRWRVRFDDPEPPAGATLGVVRAMAALSRQTARRDRAA